MKQEVYYRVQRNLPLAPIQGQINPGKTIHLMYLRSIFFSSV